jgi:hypothetical protein
MDAKYLKFNANLNVRVRLKEKGIEHYVKNHNEIMPFKYHTSFSEYESKKDKFGYHNFQLWSFIDNFGNLGMRSCQYFDINLIFELKDFEEVELKPI